MTYGVKVFVCCLSVCYNFDLNYPRTGEIESDEFFFGLSYLYKFLFKTDKVALNNFVMEM